MFNMNHPLWDVFNQVCPDNFTVLPMHLIIFFNIFLFPSPHLCVTSNRILWYSSIFHTTYIAPFFGRNPPYGSVSTQCHKKQVHLTWTFLLSPWSTINMKSTIKRLRISASKGRTHYQGNCSEQPLPSWLRGLSCCKGVGGGWFSSKGLFQVHIQLK